MDQDPIPGALALQADQCAALGSPLYSEILRWVITEYDKPGLIRDLLYASSENPVHDAIPLRFLGAIHREVLRGRFTGLQRHYASMGGAPGPTLLDDLRDTIVLCSDALRAGLAQQVQTNEVGRSLVLLSLSHWLGKMGKSEFDLLEIGSSAGLNLCFGEYCADTGAGMMGTAGSTVSFDADWFIKAPVVSPHPAVPVRAVGCDPFPIDVGDDEQAMRLLSFVWPDQIERITRLRSAIDIARRVRPTVVKASADAWLKDVLATRLTRTTVVFHSIVWQYLGREVQDNVRRILAIAGRSATSETPLLWVRMEPAGPIADVRVDIWNGTDDDPEQLLLAEIGYHGRGVRWMLPAAAY